MKLWLLGLSLLVAGPVFAAEYAVLVAGSNGYWNYRHQADVCHAYHVLINHGFNPDNIIVFSYDDVPSAPLNPFPGTLYNAPGTNPKEYNAGCVKDYTGSAVNTENFLAVLTGNKTGVTGGNGKVLTSGPNDNVFINFVDHGAPGLIAFPVTYLYADQLNTALTYMNVNNMYSKLVFYLEACESGSMFSTLLPSNTHVYATTATNTSVSSWGTYCPPDSVVNGKNLLTCLGDLYSVNWMQDSDAADFTVETLQEQFVKVRALTTQSPVEQYGDMSFSSDTLNQFQGTGSNSSSVSDVDVNKNWEAHLVKLQFLQNLAQIYPTQENQQAYAQEQAFHAQTSNNFYSFSLVLDPANQFQLMTAQRQPQDFQCLRGAVNAYEAACGPLGEFGLKFVQVLVNACESGFQQTALSAALSQSCSQVLYE